MWWADKGGLAGLVERWGRERVLHISVQLRKLRLCHLQSSRLKVGKQEKGMTPLYAASQGTSKERDHRALAKTAWMLAPDVVVLSLVFRLCFPS